MATLIDEFVLRYVREQDFYARVAELCGRQAERLLKDHSIRAITTWRAKRPERLQQKLEERDRRRIENRHIGYQTDSEIYEDIPDLAGVRIALYFPADRSRIDSLIRERFNILKERSFPQPIADLSADAQLRRERKRFAGYGATHYRVHLREEGLSTDERRYTQGRCEIQVASVLMHAWSEVEHDLEYKNLSGEVSATESALLDQINGLVIAGEIALEQLQLATYQRSAPGGTGNSGDGKRIRDQYDLANWLAGVRNTLPEADRPNIDTGRADIVFRLLQRLDETDFSSLESYRPYMIQPTAYGTMAQRLIDAILARDPKRSATLERAKLDIAAANADTIALGGFSLETLALGQFLERWRKFEEVLLAVLQDVGPYRSPYPLGRTLGLIVKESSAVIQIAEQLRQLRDASVHGSNGPPSVMDLYNNIAKLNDLVRRLPHEAKDPTRKAQLEESISKFYGTPHRKKYADGYIEIAATLVPMAHLQGTMAICVVNNMTSSSDTINRMCLRLNDRMFQPSKLDNRVAVVGIGFLEPNEKRLLPAHGVSTIGLYFSDMSIPELQTDSAGGLIIESTLAQAGVIATSVVISDDPWGG